MSEATTKRGCRMFVRLAAVGYCNDQGKCSTAIGFKGNAIAEPDRPLQMLVVGFIEQVVDLARYSSLDALKADIAALREYVGELESRATDPAADNAEGAAR
jgi:hypothetical protein